MLWVLVLGILNILDAGDGDMGCSEYWWWRYLVLWVLGMGYWVLWVLVVGTGGALGNSSGDMGCSGCW